MARQSWRSCGCAERSQWYKAFFRRLKARNGKAGFPRFRGKAWWDSFGFNEFSGIRLDGRRLRFNGMAGGLRIHLHRPLASVDIRSCVFHRDHKGWAVCLQIAIAAADQRTTRRTIGIDVGLTTLATMSDGTTIPNARIARKAERDMRRRQRALARCRRGSNRRHKTKLRLARVHAKIKATRDTYLHQASARLVADYDLIAVERLNVKGLARSILARSVHDASWAKLFSMLRYKAERAGARLVEVDPRGTSQHCSGCGVVVPKGLRERRHDCPDCGLSLDRDENAARNVLHRAVAGPGVLNCGAVA